MSGFGVVAQWIGTPDPVSVDCLQSGIEARGRDTFARRSVGQAALVHAQFATTLEAQREIQPARHVRRDVWLTADARIDNRDELREALAGQVAHPLDTDADFILAAYEHWGDDLAPQLLGDFAFAIWDAERDHMLIVRDHVGIRPAYWAHTVGGGIVASSTLRATLEASGQPREPDSVYLANFATFSGLDHEHTPWSAVRRLPGGHCLSASGGADVRTWRYWKPPDERLDVSVRDAAVQLRSLLTEAVRCRVRAPSPIGIELSGGFDSTTIAAIAAQITDRGALTTYALTFPGQRCDESTFIEAAEEHLHLRSRRLDALDVAPYDFTGDCRASLDVPLLPDNQWLSRLLQLAAADGCRVVLTGQGGDHALYGDPRAVVDELLELGEWRAAWRSLDRFDDGMRGEARTVVRGLARAHASRHGAGVVARLLSRRAQLRGARQHDADTRFLGHRLRGSESTRGSEDGDQQPLRNAQQRRRRQYTGAQSYFVELWDRSATDGGVEHRHPFLDVRLIEFVCRLSEDVIAADGRARGLHRRAFGDLLPELIRDRSDKACFDAPWIAAALPVARAICEADDRSLGSFVDQHVLSEYSATCSTEPLPSFNLWTWWGAVAVGLWSLNCQPTPCDSRADQANAE